jgi:hypothetical protein
VPHGFRSCVKGVRVLGFAIYAWHDDFQKGGIKVE